MNVIIEIGFMLCLSLLLAAAIASLVVMAILFGILIYENLIKD